MHDSEGRATALTPFQQYQAEVATWLQDSEMSRTELALLLRVEVKDLKTALSGRYPRPWILDRIRALSGIVPPSEDRPLKKGLSQTTQRYRSLLALLPGIEERIRIRQQGVENRTAMIRDLRELAARAVDFSEWLESPMLAEKRVVRSLEGE